MSAKVSPNAIAAPASSPTGRLLISLFLLFHLCVICVWAFPYNVRVFMRIKKVIAPYMLWSGLTQGWALFAPDPMYVNTYVDARVTYRDGRTKSWKFPMPQDFGYYRRYFMERDRKWSSDNLLLDSNAFLWPDAARYIARLNDDPGDPPVMVELTRHWSYIVPPNSSQAATWSQYTFFKYSVLPGDLE